MNATAYRLEIGFQKFEGSTKADGIVKHDIPASTQAGKLFLPDKVFRRKDPVTGEVTFDVWSIDLEIVALEPGDTVIGAKTRLNNLGLFAGLKADNTKDDQTRRALQRFQKREGISPAKGDLNQKTSSKLKEKYGS